MTMPSFIYVYDFRADDWAGDRKKFDGELQQLREQFDNQTKATWRTIAAAVKATFQVSLYHSLDLDSWFLDPFSPEFGILIQIFVFYY
jgi:hypothetical protein